MNGIVLPVAVLVLSIGSIIGAFFMQNRIQKKNVRITDEQRKEQEKRTAQDFVNVKEIKDIFLYTNDNFICTYIKVQPFSYDLLTLREKKVVTKNLTAELSQVNRPFKFIAVSRPVDISAIVNQYNELLMETTDQVQKQLLRNGIYQLNEFAMSGEVMQREFYYMLWDHAEDPYDIRKVTKEFLEHLENAGLKGEILRGNEIVKLCNLVNNPAYADKDTWNTNCVPYMDLAEE
ncbi:hypothetical protein [[Clostridium] polysaccharolyticum]|uniref:Uncharacterized protein n=1 Tax=[Clostridium] polysaccharolyticum TaxID=29364 RepID=A0A1H9Y9G3_9FIRM|nr:hypothetical protein [[Clostridium] polysaccharolyticum]SES65470.1 hypothetical protein SAMN04487772_101229 [[Clostridium] polysaccharolyticum]